MDVRCTQHRTDPCASLLLPASIMLCFVFSGLHGLNGPTWRLKIKSSICATGMYLYVSVVQLSCLKLSNKMKRACISEAWHWFWQHVRWSPLSCGCAKKSPVPVAPQNLETLETSGDAGAILPSLHSSHFLSNCCNYSCKMLEMCIYCVSQRDFEISALRISIFDNSLLSSRVEWTCFTCWICSAEQVELPLVVYRL